MNTANRLKRLFESTHWSEEDKEWVMKYLESTDHHELRKLMEKMFEQDVTDNEHYSEKNQILSLIHQKMEPGKPEAQIFAWRKWKQISIAASLLLVAGLTIFLISKNPVQSTAVVKQPIPASGKDQVVSGHNNATLTLADGTTIVLDTVNNGALVHSGNMHVTKTGDQISYATSSAAGGQPVYHIMSTAKGNQYQLQLADGSKVWLNAESSIRFPTEFTGSERRVEITGEVYFEVAPNARMPFRVQVNSSAGESCEVEVLGTHFNINAYDDETLVKTTLDEGKVSVNIPGTVVMLEPGYQAILNKQNRKLQQQQANVEKELAWKMGMFEFHDDDLLSIMRQISRWYNVDVKFDGPVSGKLFNGSIRRQATLLQVLQILKVAGVSYELHEKNLTIKSQ